MVFIMVTYGKLVIKCSGFLIENGMKNETDILLTASHCLHIDEKYQPPGNVHFLVGAHNVKNVEDRIRRRARNYVTHFYKSMDDDNDIAMVRLDRPVAFSSHVIPLCLPDREMPELEDKKCFAAGWGTTEQNKSSSTLKMTRLVVLPDDFCESFVHVERELCVAQRYKDYNTCEVIE
ncbi:trypsin [Trichuris suis]|nr:trypsin [Trichuris suis]